MLTRRTNARFDPSRRHALRTLAAVLPAVAAAACAPARIVLRAYPAEFKGDSARTKATLVAFVCTVEPGASADPACAERALQDPAYPLASYAGYLASDLDERANRAHHCPFTDLSCDDRAAVVASGVAAGGVTGKLYAGAVYLTQIAVYAGLGSPDGLAMPPKAIHRDAISRRTAAFPSEVSRGPRQHTLDGNP
jgi:hypothetical protein